MGLSKTEKFENVMKTLDAYVVDDLKSPVLVEDDGKGAVARVKYGL